MLTPHSDHPLFKAEIRRIRWGETPRRLWRYTLMVFGLVGVLVLVLWVLALITTPTSSYYMDRLAISGDFIGLLFLASIALDILLDFVCLWFTVDSIDKSANPMKWDLLRLTTTRLEVIVAAKHALAQVRAWRVMALIIGLRLSIVFLVCCHFILLEQVDWGQILSDINVWIGLITLIIFALVYVIEPYWRMQAMTALGLGHSARFGNPAMVILVGTGKVLAVWIEQVIVIVITLYAGAAFIGLLVVGILIACCLTAGVIYAFYLTMQALNLTAAQQHTFAE